MNATEAYQKYGKAHTAFANYKDRTLVPYAEKLIELGKITMSQKVTSADNQPVTVDDLIVVRKGGNPHEQGTWLHFKLAVEFARWLELEFGIWCNEKIEELGKITKPQIAASLDPTGSKPLTVDDLIVTRKGGNPHEQGTWLHYKLAVEFSRWLELEFGIWCNEKIEELLA